MIALSPGRASPTAAASPTPSKSHENALESTVAHCASVRANGGGRGGGTAYSLCRWPRPTCTARSRWCVWKAARARACIDQGSAPPTTPDEGAPNSLSVACRISSAAGACAPLGSSSICVAASSSVSSATAGAPLSALPAGGSACSRSCFACTARFCAAAARTYGSTEPSASRRSSSCCSSERSAGESIGHCVPRHSRIMMRACSLA